MKIPLTCKVELLIQGIFTSWKKSVEARQRSMGLANRPGGEYLFNLHREWENISPKWGTFIAERRFSLAANGN